MIRRFCGLIAKSLKNTIYMLPLNEDLQPFTIKNLIDKLELGKEKAVFLDEILKRYQNKVFEAENAQKKVLFDISTLKTWVKFREHELDKGKPYLSTTLNKSKDQVFLDHLYWALEAIFREKDFSAKENEIKFP